MATNDRRPDFSPGKSHFTRAIRDVIGGRAFDMSQKYLPDGLSLVPDFTMLPENEKRFASQIQGRTYANVFGLVERFINAKVLEVSRDDSPGDQVALEALVRFSDEGLKHRALFRRIERMIGERCPLVIASTSIPMRLPP